MDTYTKISSEEAWDNLAVRRAAYIALCLHRAKVVAERMNELDADSAMHVITYIDFAQSSVFEILGDRIDTNSLGIPLGVID